MSLTGVTNSSAGPQCVPSSQSQRGCMITHFERRMALRCGELLASPLARKTSCTTTIQDTRA